MMPSSGDGAAPSDSGGRPLDCVVLAAGASTRMGRAKIHLPLSGTTVVGATVAHALEAGLRVIVVARADDAAIDALAGPRVLVVRNLDPERGMLSSIREGVREVRSDRFFFIPADMPFPGPGIYRSLAGIEARGPLIPTCAGRRGHPVLMP